MSSSHTDVPPVEGSLVAVEMPKMGISVSEGTIVEWRKAPGDAVEADETIADVTTDKIDVEIPSPASGTVARLVVEAGNSVEVGTVIAEIDSGGGPGPNDGGDEADRSGFYSPVVRRIAAKHGINLEAIAGTGIGGRVRKRDVLAHVREVNGNGAPAAQKTLHTESPYKPDPDRGEHREPMTVMRQAIARHMVDSRRTAAHCTTIVEVDMSRVASRRAALKDGMARKGVPLTYLAFVAVATVEALERHPVLNASVDGDDLVYHDDVNLGIAVALDDGLIVPVIRQAQRLSLEGMTAAIAAVAERARSKRLEPDDVQGGTFTITNPGQFGAVLATPIISQPQVAILDLEAIVKRAVVVADPAGADSIAIRPMTYLPMSWDHRALDGAEAAKFLSRVKARLEDWEVE
jgi:2-oxoglutarate dehydrogenase complex dihydrolipoamide succinyltransferase (E2) component